jgi:hypothetical protein
MSAITNTMSMFGPRAELGPDGQIWVCGKPLQPADESAKQLASAQDLARHGNDAVASPWASAKSSPSAERLDQMALNPQPLPPRLVGIGKLERIDDFCGTRVPLRVPPPPPPTPFAAGLPMQADALSVRAERSGASRIDQKAAELETRQQRATQEAEQARDARAGWANALKNLFGADTPKLHPGAEAAQELASTKLQTMLAQLQEAEHKAATMGERLGDLQSALSKRV